MRKVVVTKNVKVPVERAWELLSDFGNVQLFNPIVETAEVLSENDRGLGAQRRCNLYNNTSAVEEITEWNEGEGLTVAITDAPMPVKNATVRMHVEPAGPQSSAVTFEMNYVPKWGFLGRVMDVLLIRMMMRHTFGKVIRGLKHHARTGEVVEKSGEAERNVTCCSPTGCGVAAGNETT